jgi:hypothetical protein
LDDLGKLDVLYEWFSKKKKYGKKRILYELLRKPQKTEELHHFY